MKKPKPKVSRWGRNLPGLIPKNVKAGAQDFNDQDYVHRLSREEREWLSEFNVGVYNGYFPGEKIKFSQKQQREIWRDLNHLGNGPNGITDAYALARVTGGLEQPDHHQDGEGLSWDEIPADDQHWETRSESEAFKAAQEQVRKTVPPLPMRKNGRVKLTPEFKKAKRTLVAINKRELAQKPKKR
jgi:hypothetical protein